MASYEIPSAHIALLFARKAKAERDLLRSTAMMIDFAVGTWCEECGCRTNHDTIQHRDAENDPEIKKEP